MIVKKVPGAEEVYMVYDARDRLVMTQDGNQRAQGKWLYTQYDALNRPISTGLISDASAPTTPTMFANHRNGAFNSTTYPNLASYTEEILTRTFYDDYLWSTNGSTPKNPLGSTISTGTGYTDNFFAVDGAFPYAEPTEQSMAVLGLVTGTKVKVLGTANDYLYTAYYYDDKGRVIQTKTQNISGGTDVVTNQYSFNGQLLTTKLRQQKSGTGAITTTVTTRNNYDELGRLIKVEKRINNINLWKQLSLIEYDALGQLEKKSWVRKAAASRAPHLTTTTTSAAGLLALIGPT